MSLREIEGILNIFLDFCYFDPSYSYKHCSYKENGVVGEVGCRRCGMSDKWTKRDFKVQYSDIYTTCRRSGMSKKWDAL